jgi:hypothetical protein
MKEWDLRVRIDAELDYLAPPGSTHERIVRQHAQLRVAAMAQEIAAEVRQRLADKINAEIDLARAQVRTSGEP